MAGSTYYLRLRGRITGPFDLPSLQKLVRRGAISRIHELSRDQVAWTDAGSVEGLFSASVEPPPLPPITEPVSTGIPPSLPTLTMPALPAASVTKPVGNMAKYYYRQADSTVGPVPLAILRSLAETGKLDRTALVWTTSPETARPASQVAELRFSETAAPATAARGVDVRVVIGVATVCFVLLLAIAIAVAAFWVNRHPGEGGPTSSELSTHAGTPATTPSTSTTRP